MRYHQDSVSYFKSVTRVDASFLLEVSESPRRRDGNYGMGMLMVCVCACVRVCVCVCVREQLLFWKNYSLFLVAGQSGKATGYGTGAP